MRGKDSEEGRNLNVSSKWHLNSGRGRLEANLIKEVEWGELMETKHMFKKKDI